MENSLYEDWAAYRLLFPTDEESLLFYRAVTNGCQRILDAGCGPGDLAQLLESENRLVVGVDLVQPPPGPGSLVRGDLLRLPFGDGSFDGVVSRLFGVAYAAGVGRAAPLQVAAELARVSAEGARFALELPVAWRPHRLQGLEESTPIIGGFHYRFRYLDELERNAFGSVLQTSIVLSRDSEVYSVDAPLQVFTPDGAGAWFDAANADIEGFCAPYDLGTLTKEPPADCLRAVVYGSRRGGGGAAAPSTVANG